VFWHKPACHRYRNITDCISGAVFLDGGLEAADKFLSKLLSKSLDFTEFSPCWDKLPPHPLQVYYTTLYAAPSSSTGILYYSVFCPLILYRYIILLCILSTQPLQIVYTVSYILSTQPLLSLGRSYIRVETGS